MKNGIKTLISGVAMFLLGAFVIPLIFILPLILGQNKEDQFKIPGITKVVVEKPGRYYLWNDYQTIYEGRSYIRSETIPDGIQIKITNAGGESLKFVSNTSISSRSGSSAKNSIGYVEVASPAELIVEVTGGTEERIFSFAKSGILKIIGLIFGGLGLSMIVAFSGIGITVWGIVKLVKSSKKSEQVDSADRPERGG